MSIVQAKQQIFTDINNSVIEYLNNHTVQETVDSLNYTKHLIIDQLNSLPSSDLLSMSTIQEVKMSMLNHIEAILVGLTFKEVVVIDKETGEILS